MPHRKKMIDEIYPGGHKPPDLVNTWRVLSTEENFIIDFGYFVGKDQVKVVSRNCMKQEDAPSLCANLIQAMINSNNKVELLQNFAKLLSAVFEDHKGDA